MRQRTRRGRWVGLRCNSLPCRHLWRRPHLEDAKPPDAGAALLLETLLQLSPEQLPEGYAAESVRALAARWFPRAAPLLWFLARQDFDAGRYPEAEARLRRLVAMGRDHSYDRTVSFDPKILGDEAHLNLGACLVRQAKLREAKQMLKPLRGHPVHGRAAAANLATIRDLEHTHGVAPKKPRPKKKPKKRKSR